MSHLSWVLDLEWQIRPEYSMTTRLACRNFVFSHGNLCLLHNQAAAALQGQVKAFTYIISQQQIHSKVNFFSYINILRNINRAL